MRGQTTLSDFRFKFYQVFRKKGIFEGKNADGFSKSADVSGIDDVTPTFLVIT